MIIWNLCCSNLTLGWGCSCNDPQFQALKLGICHWRGQCHLLTWLLLKSQSWVHSTNGLGRAPARGVWAQWQLFRGKQVNTQCFCLGLGVISLFCEHALFSETELLKLFRLRVGACAILPEDLGVGCASSVDSRCIISWGRKSLILWLLVLV